MSPAYKSKIGVTIMTMGILVGGVTMMANTYQAAASSTPEILPVITPTPTVTHKPHKKITKPVVVSPVVTKPAPSHGHSGGSK